MRVPRLACARAAPGTRPAHGLPMQGWGGRGELAGRADAACDRSGAGAGARAAPHAESSHPCAPRPSAPPLRQ
jgi:hypothetical protein